MESITTQISNQRILELLGQRLKASRLNQNLTQQQLADRAGVSKSMLRLAESGKKSLGLLNLIALLRALGQLDQLDALLPQTAPRPEGFVQTSSPQAFTAAAHKPRQRARKRKTAATANTWQWADKP